jgi:predicted nuclease of predicted toxin-antitoxin system
MKLLVDQNISFRLVSRLEVEFPLMSHVKDHGLIDKNDYSIFDFARSNHFDAIVTLDTDFFRILLERGTPPRIIWLRISNASTSILAQKLLEQKAQILAFLANPNVELLEIY